MLAKNLISAIILIIFFSFLSLRRENLIISSFNTNSKWWIYLWIMKKILALYLQKLSPKQTRSPMFTDVCKEFIASDHNFKLLATLQWSFALESRNPEIFKSN